MRRLLQLSLAALLLAGPSVPVFAQAQAPHAWLFGTWTGGVFPVPEAIPGAACFAQPVRSSPATSCCGRC